MARGSPLIEQAIQCVKKHRVAYCIVRKRLFLYFSGQATNQIGDAVFLTALPFLYLSEQRLAELSIVLTAYTVGRLVLVGVGGAVTVNWPGFCSYREPWPAGAGSMDS